jgi:hypothetical protein
VFFSVSPLLMAAGLPDGNRASGSKGLILPPIIGTNAASQPLSHGPVFQIGTMDMVQPGPKAQT